MRVYLNAITKYINRNTRRTEESNMTEIKARNHASAVSFLTSTILTRKVHGNSYNFSSTQAF